MKEWACLHCTMQRYGHTNGPHVTHPTQACPERERVAQDPERQRGFTADKFKVTRTDGSTEPGGKHENCRFFVLDLQHDKFAPAALEAYRRACRMEYPTLAADIAGMLERSKVKK